MTRKGGPGRAGRRFEALEALVGAPGGEKMEGGVQQPGSVTPLDLAKAWRITPSGTYQLLERLRKFGLAERAGVGHGAHYRITDKGIQRLEWHKKPKKK